jgi:glutamate receptor, ionotropic, invertebrate
VGEEQIMDERWESEIIEYGAINITGFRILDSNKRYVRDFLDGWRKLDATTSPGAGKEQISVSFSSFPPQALTNDR